MRQGFSHWYELQDLNVVDILPQMITLSESYMQVFCYRRPRSLRRSGKDSLTR